MKFNKVLDAILISTPTYLIKDLHKGDAYERISSGTVKYGFFSVAPQSISTGEDGTRMTVQIVAADRLKQDDSNTMDVFTDMYTAVRSTLNKVEEDYSGEIEILSANYEFFKQQFSDYVGGVVVTVDVAYVDDIGSCAIEENI